MDQQAKKPREKRGSILKQHSTFSFEDYSDSLASSQNSLHVKLTEQQKLYDIEDEPHANVNKQNGVIRISSESKVTFIEQEGKVFGGYQEKKSSAPQKFTSSQMNEIRRPSKDLSKLTEAQLVKLSMKSPQIWEEDDKDSDEDSDEEEDKKQNNKESNQKKE